MPHVSQTLQFGQRHVALAQSDMDSIGALTHMACAASPQSQQYKKTPPFLSAGGKLARARHAPGAVCSASVASAPPHTRHKSWKQIASASRADPSESSAMVMDDSGSWFGRRSTVSVFLTAEPVTRSFDTASALSARSFRAFSRWPSRALAMASPCLDNAVRGRMSVASFPRMSSKSREALVKNLMASFQILSPGRLKRIALCTMSSASARTGCAARYSPFSALTFIVERSMGNFTTSA
mmetsp:Transcript_35137/g.108873  ORF Transcript_35137/g.108873 Transcript_35137/m.108873 type:complete len:239 (+) Transcript_35137:469-1185(+)